MAQKNMGIGARSAALAVIAIILAAGGAYWLSTRGKSSSTSASASSTTTQSSASLESSSSTTSVCVSSNTMSYQDNIALIYGLTATDLWNLRSASGDLKLCYQPSGIYATIDLTNVTAGLKQPGDFVGYPEVSYGYSAGDTPFGQMDSNLVFPIKLETFTALNFSSSVTYSVSAPSTQPLDFSYDLWIEGNPQPNHGTQSTDLELMISMDNQTFAGTGPQVGNFTTPATINDSSLSSTWGVHVSMPTSQRPHELVDYLLNHPVRAGSISIQIRELYPRCDSALLVSAFKSAELLLYGHRTRIGVRCSRRIRFI